MIKVIRKCAVLLIILAVLTGSLSLNAIEAADGNKAAAGNQTEGGDSALSDAARGNFRNVCAGRIGRNNLYRSQHPANGSVRSLYANELAEENGIRTVLDLSDSKKSAEKYIRDYIVGSSYYYKTLYKSGRVYTAGLSETHRGSSYPLQVAAGLRFFVKNKGPYLVHCEVGRDRTGLVILLLESLMGVPYEYMLGDYAQTYINLLHCSPVTARQKAIPHVNEELKYISGLKKAADWRKVNLIRYAVLYLKKGGMTDREISLLKKNLSVSYPARTVSIESLCTK